MKPSKSIHRVVIADDHELVRSGLQCVLSEIADVEIVGHAENGLEAITLVQLKRPDLLTLDAGMPLAPGMEVYSEVRRIAPETRIAVVTGFSSCGYLGDWVDAGVDGLFLKTCHSDEVKHGFELVLAGETYVSRTVTAILERQAARPPLTHRERQVLHFIAAGFNNREIATKLSISPKTVDNHRTRLMAKLNVNSTVQLITYALKEGLLDQTQQLLGQDNPKAI